FLPSTLFSCPSLGHIDGMKMISFPVLTWSHRRFLSLTWSHRRFLSSLGHIDGMKMIRLGPG
ncbi:hypothetical protein L9F63_016807, partial [Diploptera punctata]